MLCVNNNDNNVNYCMVLWQREEGGYFVVISKRGYV